MQTKSVFCTLTSERIKINPRRERFGYKLIVSSPFPFQDIFNKGRVAFTGKKEDVSSSSTAVSENP